MSFYTSGIKQILTDPIIDINMNRVEWRLQPNTLYTSDLKILNIGVFDTGEPKLMNARAGAWASVKNIYLQDNGTTIDQALNVNTWMAWKNYNMRNVKSASMSRYLAANDMGMGINSEQQNGRLILPKFMQPTDAASAKGSLSLRDALPFLRATEYLPTSIFTHLTIVIEYEQAGAALWVQSVLKGTKKSLENPLIKVDEIINEEAVREITSSWSGVGWNCYERDIAHVGITPATTTTKQLSNSKSVLVKGFDNKYINRLLICPIPSDPKAHDTGSAAALVTVGGTLVPVRQIDGKCQVVVNGANVLVGSGVQRSNETLALLTDTFGECSVDLATQTTGLYADKKQVYGSQTGGPNNGEGLQAFASRSGYIGMPIQQRISSLSISYDFTNQFNQFAAATYDKAASLERFNTPLNLFVFGEVRKSLVVKPDGTYVISYS